MKNLVTKIIVPILIVGSTLFGQQYHAKNLDKINIFVQPNDSTLAWYGSGDVDGNNVFDWNDYTAIDNMQNDQSDIDGDGISSTNNDKYLLGEFLNGTKEYLPAHWNALETTEQRIDWLDKMLAIDKTDTITYDYPNWVSGDYGAQTSLNFAGFKFGTQEDKELAATKFDTTNIGRFNIPVYHSAYSSPNFAHGQNACNVDENAKNPNHYAYPDQVEGSDQYNDLKIIGQNMFPPANSGISVDRLTKPFENNQGDIVFYIENLVDFRSGDDAVLNVYNYNPNVIETREQAMDESYPALNLSGIENNSIHNPNYTTININVSDEYFDRAGYSLNNSDTTWFSTPDTSVYLNSQLGDNEVLIIAEDKAGNQTLEKRVYKADSSVNIEESDKFSKDFKLYKNYPNPFNSTTTIKYNLPNEEKVNLTIYDINGREVDNLLDNKMPAGEHEIHWNSSEYPSGTYFYQLQTPTITKIKKMTYVK